MERLTKRNGDNVAYWNGANGKNFSDNQGNIYGEAITKLAEYEDAEEQGLLYGKWIPCRERLPEDGKNCLITYISFLDGVTKCCDGCAYVIENGWFWCLDDSEVKVDVIAWMPLPEPYKEEDHGWTNRNAHRGQQHYKTWVLQV